LDSEMRSTFFIPNKSKSLVKDLLGTPWILCRMLYVINVIYYAL